MATRRARRLGLTIALIAMACAGVLVTVRGWPETDPDRLRQQALIELQSGRFSGAAAALDRLRSRGRLTPADWMLRAQVDLALGRIPEALSDLQAVPDDDPMAPRARLQEGQIELRRDRARAAEAAFLRAVARDPKLIEARRQLVYIYGMQMRRRELHAQFEALSELTPLTFDQVRLWCLTRMSDWDPREVQERPRVVRRGRSRGSCLAPRPGRRVPATRSSGRGRADAGRAAVSRTRTLG